MEQAYRLILAICGLGIVVDSLERLVTLKKYRHTGLFSWEILRQRLVSMPMPLRRAADCLFARPEFLAAVLLLRIGGVLLVLSTPFRSGAYSVGLTVLVFGQIYVLARSGFGAIGADSMTLIVCGGTWLATAVADTTLAARAGLWFIAAQGCLGYAVAGISKLAAPKWRSGEAMTTVLSTYAYGNQGLFTVLRRRPWLSSFSSWGAMLWEATFPIALIVPDRVLIAQFALGLLFHASVAQLMGLNLFLAAFPSTYVAIWAIRH